MELSCGVDLESEPFRIFDALLHLIRRTQGLEGVTLASVLPLLISPVLRYKIGIPVFPKP